ncbi:hypothetical protein GGI15_001509 [Coemansia interrupta]|uniref:GCS light chain n=1 Tax=Coemansia interrupta TaxID=1126814 RepID=A0A9W8HHT9_9FUNG|nr:hypothetical protein GGI15_001509 [Coemansia interrupta]
MTRRRQEITEKVPTTPRKVVVYTDNLMTSNSARNTVTGESSSKELANSLAETLNTALVISTSFRFDPELNTLEILDPYNPRNNIQVKGITDYKVSVKVFMLPTAVDVKNRPSTVYVKQAMASVQRQLGAVKIDELVVSFAEISAQTPGGLNESSSVSSLTRPGTSQADSLLDQGRPLDSPGQAGISTIDDANNDTSTTGSRTSNDDSENDMSRYLKVWRLLNRFKRSGDASKIGISDVTKSQLEQLCQQSEIKPDIVQIRLNLNDPSDQSLDGELRAYAKEQGISVSAHADEPVVLSDRTFQMLASDFKINERFPTTEVAPQGYKMDFMRPRWVANYTVMQTKRGLVANRGYIAMASSDCVLDPNRISPRPKYSMFGGFL